MTQRTLHSNYTSGQLASTFKARRDDKRYYQGVQLSRNAIPLPTGGDTRRPGFKFAADVSAFPSRMIAWQSSPTKSYMILVQPSASNVSFEIYKRSGGATTEVHSFTSSISDVNDGWTTAAYDQSRDVMYIALDGGTKVKKLSNTGGDTSWTFEDVQEIDGPFEDINLNVGFQMNANGQSGSVEIKAQTKAAGNKPYFDSNDVGKLIRIRHNVDPSGDSANYWGCAIITGLKTGTDTGGLYHTVEADLQTFADDNELSFGAPRSSTDPNATVNWRLGTFSAENGYPDYVTFHQNRLWNTLKNRFCASRTNDFERHSPTLPDQENNHSQTADSAIDVSLTDLREETINWMHSDQVLHVGTNTARYALTGSTPQDIKISRQSNVGVARIDPVFIDNLIYARYDREALLYADFNFRRDRFEDKNLNLVSDEILRPKVSRLAVTNYPFNIVWALLDDGTLASLTYDPEQEVSAWAIHDIEGLDIINIESLRTEDDKQVLYAIVQNTTTPLPATVHLCELDLTSLEYLSTADAANEAILDCYITLSDTASVSSQEQFDGINIMAIQDGINYPQTGTVDSSGNFTLAESISGSFQVGIPIDFRIEHFPVALPSTPDAASGRLKNVNSVDITLHRTSSCRLQLTTSEYPEDIDFRLPEDDVGEMPPFRNKEYNVPLSTSSDEETSLIITQNEQGPITVLGVNYNVEVEDLS